MFDIDNWLEIFHTIRKNKLRTFLTGFSVAWGIFMLIVLLAAGNGLGNGIAYNFRNMQTNTVTAWTRYTTLPYKGMQPNRRFYFTDKDYYAVKREHPEVGLISAANYRSGVLTFDKEYLNVQTVSVHPDYASIYYKPINQGDGRFINEIDILERRKVIVITPRIASVLFRDSISPLGQYTKLDNIMFQVVGIYQDENNNNDAPVYIPFSTGQMLYANGLHIHNLEFTLNGINTEAESDAFEQRFRERMARRHRFDPADKNVIGMWNSGNEFRMWQGMNNGIALFIWIVGIGTLMAGIVGVSNIMLITVRERTKEFGIRKAIGAKPSSILRLIIVESVLVTAVFGYIGMVTGIGLTELINYAMEMSGASGGTEHTTVFRNPTVNITIALSATGLLIIAGVLAGYFPARKAVKISAVEAMRAE